MINIFHDKEVFPFFSHQKNKSERISLTAPPPPPSKKKAPDTYFNFWLQWLSVSLGKKQKNKEKVICIIVGWLTSNLAVC